MLTIGKLGRSPDQLQYYEQQVAQGIEDYYSGRGEAPGRWIGGGCGGIGLAGQVDRDGFMRAMNGCDPRSGERLRPEHGQSKVAAFDLTFSAPKSVSVLFAIADEETSGALLEAHERAAEASGRPCFIRACPSSGLSDMPNPLSSEQLAAVRALATDGRGVSVLQALAGTGKTRVLAGLARVYESASYRVIGVAPTGRAARELGDVAGIPAFTIHRLVSELEKAGGFGERTVVLFDEAGSAPTRPSARLLAAAERAGAKVIVAGDAGQLPSVAAGGWFAAIAERLGGPELRQVIRQRDSAERDALEALHDGDPEPYIALKRGQRALTVHNREVEALAALMRDWDHARREHGTAQAVMIARDNATRELLNDCARQLLVRDGTLDPDRVIIADHEFRVGERVIARRNDRHRDVDNGTLGHVVDVDPLTGELTVITDAGQRRALDASYVAEHLEHAYALTGHGAQGATVEWAGVIGRPAEFTREWAYTALTRARGPTRVYMIAEAMTGQRERERYAPAEPPRTTEEALRIMTVTMRRREAEALAIESTEPADLSSPVRAPGAHLPLAELAEAGAEQALKSTPWRSPSDLSSGPLHRQWDAPDRHRGIER